MPGQHDFAQPCEAIRRQEGRRLAFDHSVKTEKPVAKEPPHAAFAHVDYAKLALLKPAFTVASETAKTMHAASATMKDPSVKKDLAAAKTVAAPVVREAAHHLIETFKQNLGR